MKRLLTLSAVIITLCFAGCKYDDTAIVERLEKLENDTSIATLKEQVAAISNSIKDLEKMDVELKGYITVLQTAATDLSKDIADAEKRLDEAEENIKTAQGDITDAKNEIKTIKDNITTLTTTLGQVNDTISKLQERDDEIAKSIATLQTYVDTELDDAKDWVEATFATLEQYNALAEDVADIKQSIVTINQTLEDINKRIDDEMEAVATTITALEDSMKEWVNEQLTGYYTIAQVDAALELLKGSMDEADTALAEEIEKLAERLDSMAEELTTAYTKAIEDAITTHNGVMSEKIATEVATLNTRIDSEVATINARIDSLEERIADLEEAIDKIKSLDIEFSDTDDLVCFAGASVELGYTIVNGDEQNMIECFGNGGWDAMLTAESASTGKIKVTAPQNAGNGKVIVLATSGAGGVVMKALNFEKGILTDILDRYEAEWQACTVAVTLKTNLHYNVNIPTDAAEWLSVADTRAEVRTETLTFSLTENPGDTPRSTTITLTNNYGDVLQAFEIEQSYYSLYRDNFDGKESTKTFGAGSSWPYINQFPEFANAEGPGAMGVTYSGSGATVRTTTPSDSDSEYAGSGMNNIHIGSSSHFQVNNILLNPALKNYKLSFGAMKAAQDGSTLSATEFTVHISKNGNDWEEIKYNYTATANQWGKATADFTLTEVPETLYVKFYTTTANAYVIDDVELSFSLNGGQSITLPDPADVIFNAANIDIIYYDNEYSEAYNYCVVLSDNGLEGESRKPNSIYYYLDLYSDVRSSYDSGVVPNSVYNLASTFAPNTLSTSFSGQIITTSGKEETIKFQSGKAVVSNGKIEASFILADGTRHDIIFEGSLAWNNNSEEEGPVFEPTHTATEWLWGGESIYGNKYSVSGETLSMDIHLPAEVAQESSITAGSYTWVSSSLFGQSETPNYFTARGVLIDGERLVVDSGMMVVEATDALYHIELTLIGRDGNTYMILYEGAITSNKEDDTEGDDSGNEGDGDDNGNDNGDDNGDEGNGEEIDSEAKTTLTGDHVVTFPDKPVAKWIYEGSKWGAEFSAYTIAIINKDYGYNVGDTIQLDIITDAANNSGDFYGTYAISKTAGKGVAIAGHTDKQGHNTGSWYFEYDSADYINYAALVKGSVTITDNGDGTSTVELDAYDGKNNHITCNWSGEIVRN